MLYIIPTPIGNLKDVTLRAIEVLNQVDIILCEDTRTSSKLLSSLNISKQLISYHKFNERKMCQTIIDMLKQEKQIALISDSGTPLISDPGYILIKELNKNNLNYTVLPGACACITALVYSGFDTSSFSFFGFLPEKQSAKNKMLEEISNYKTTLVFHVSVHSLKKEIASIAKILGNRNACLTRELSKIYEQKIYFKLTEDFEITEKGEFILIVEGQKEHKKTDDFKKEIEEFIRQGMTQNQAIGKTAKLMGIDRNELYKKLKD